MKKITAVLLSIILIIAAALPAMASEETKPFENSEFYTQGDYEIHYRTFSCEGKEKGQMLLLHGFCLSTVSLEGVAAEYAKAGYKVVLADVPNFGYSSRETASTELIDREELMYGLIESLGGKWIVGGHSMGGGIAINLATDYPDMVEGLVLYAPQTSVESNAAMAMFAKSGIMGLMLNMIIKLALIFPSLVESLVEMSFSDKEFAENYELSRITDPFRISGTGTGVAMMMSHTRGSDLEALSALEIPCIIFTAADDRVASADNLQAIIDNAPEGTVVISDLEGGHMMMEYSPELVAEETLKIFG